MRLIILKNIRDLLARLGLLCRLESAIVDELERHGTRLYALEENRKLKDADILDMKKELQDLRAEVRGKVVFHVDT